MRLPQIATLVVAMAVSSSLLAAEIVPIDHYQRQPLKTGELTTVQQIQRLKNQMQYALAAVQKTKDLQNQVDELRGQQEYLQHQLTAMQAQMSAVTTPPKSQSNKSTPSEKPSVMKKVISAEQKAYDAAYRFVERQHYQEALNGFTHFVKTYPKSHLNNQAYYWIGELYLVHGDPTKAAAELQKVIRNPDGIKAPDAMYKLGMIYVAQGQMSRAKGMFKRVVANYPGTDAAKQAGQQLKTMH